MEIKNKIRLLLVLLPYIQCIIIIVIYNTDAIKTRRHYGNGKVEGLHFLFQIGCIIFYRYVQIQNNNNNNNVVGNMLYINILHYIITDMGFRIIYTLEVFVYRLPKKNLQT